MEANQRLSVAEEVFAEPRQHTLTIRNRIEALEAKRQAITQRRLAGEAGESEAAEFAALGGDIGVLRTALAEAEAHAAALEPTELRHQAQRAASVLKAHEQTEVLSALHERAKALEATFVSCVAELARRAQAAGRQNLIEVFQPSDSLKAIANRTSIGAIAVL